VRDRARGNLANAPLEGGVPLVVGAVGANRVEPEFHVGARLAGALAHDELPQRRRFAPVHVPRIFAGPHQAKAEELVAVAATDDVVRPGRATGRSRGQLHGVDRGIDHELPRRGHLARFLE